MNPSGDLFIWEQVPKYGDCPPKMGTFGRLTLKGTWRLRKFPSFCLLPSERHFCLQSIVVEKHLQQFEKLIKPITPHQI